MSSHPIVGVLLAAGAGSRFGGDKLLARLEDGSSVGVRSLAQLQDAVDTVVAVVRPGDSVLEQQLEATGVRITRCPHAARGMGASLAWGIRAAPVAAGWLVALADMPWIRTETLLRVCTMLKDGRDIVVPSFGHQRGHPVGFAARFYGQLITLDGDQGARSLCEAHADRTMVLETDDRGVVRDVDVRGDI